MILNLFLPLVDAFRLFTLAIFINVIIFKFIILLVVFCVLIDYLLLFLFLLYVTLYFVILFNSSNGLLIVYFKINFHIVLHLRFAIYTFNFSQLFVGPPQTAILLFCISFFLGMVLLPISCTMSRISVHSSSGTLSIRSSPLNLFLTSTV